MHNLPRRPQLTSDEMQQLKWLLGGVLALLAASTVLYMDIDAWMLMAITMVAATATIVRPTLPAKIPPLAHTLAFPVIVAFFAADLWLRAEVLPSMVRLDMLLLLYRSITYRQRRDDLQVIVLGLFLVVVAGVLTVSLVFAAQILVYTACALAFLFAITVSEPDRKGGKNPAISAQPGMPPAWAAQVDWRRLFRRLREVADWRVVALGVALFAGVVAVSAVLFMAIPRFQLENAMFLDRFISKQAKTGFSDTIRFGDVTDIQQDTSVALSVDVTDQTQVPMAPYWRMLVLDDYHDGTFRLSPVMRARELGPNERTTQRLVGEARPQRGEDVFWTFYLESGVSRYLPLLGQFEVLQFREVQNFRRAARLNLIALRNEPVTMTAYRVEGFVVSNALSDPEFAQRWRTRGSETADRALFRGLAVTENERAMLVRWTGEIAGNAAGGNSTRRSASEFAARASKWLRDQHEYSRSPRIPAGGGDPLVRWMGSRERGHCELFAGSFVLLARAAGFPARVITGFNGGSWNGYSNNFTIRNSDAHAWAEIFDESAGAWLRADPLAPAETAQTQAGTGEAAVAQRLDRSWGARFDSLRVFWYRRIVSFDQRSQLETLRSVKDAAQNSGRRVREALEAAIDRAKAWLTAPWDRVRVATVGGWLLGAVALAWLWKAFGRAWWRRTRHGAGSRRDDPVRREAGYWLVRIANDEGRGTGAEQTVAELQRLRFGPRASWTNPEKTFRHARRWVRAARRAERAPISRG